MKENKIEKHILRKKKMIRQLLLTTMILFSVCPEIFCFPSKTKDEQVKGREFFNAPQRIISLGPSLTEELYLLEAEDKLVANTIFCQRPPEAGQKAKTGTVIKVNIEKIVSLKPDLVLATSLTDPEQVKKLKNLGIRVVSFPSAKNFSHICEQFLELGKMVNREKRAKEIVDWAKYRVDSIKRGITHLSQPKVFVQVGTKPLFTITKDSFINDFIELARGVNIAMDAKTGLFSREEVLKQNPEVIIIVTMGVVGEQEKKIWQKYETLRAVKNNRIHIVDSYKICSPTPVSFVEALQEIVNILHPSKEGG